MKLVNLNSKTNEQVKMVNLKSEIGEPSDTSEL